MASDEFGGRAAITGLAAGLLHVAPRPGGDIDVEAVRHALAAVESVCRGEAHVDFDVGSRATAYGVRDGADDQSSRFGFLRAPRSTVVQPSPVHGGLTDDPAAELQRLLETLVR